MMTNSGSTFETVRKLWGRLVASFSPAPVQVQLVEHSATHHLDLDGITGFVMLVKDGGLHITVSGWTPAHWKWREGDYLILRRSGTTTRYRIEKMSRPGNPMDQYFADCVFAPRGVV